MRPPSSGLSAAPILTSTRRRKRQDGLASVRRIKDWRYVAVSLAAGGVTFLWYWNLTRLHPIGLLLGAAGLALFAVAGTQKALAFGVNPFVAALLGMLTGIGGGVLRDLLVNEIPIVLRADLYAVAALAGAGVVVAGHLLHWPASLSTVAGAILCFGMRLVASRRGWRLPPATLSASRETSRRG